MNASPAVAKPTVAPNQNLFCRISEPAEFFKKRAFHAFVFQNKSYRRALQQDQRPRQGGRSRRSIADSRGLTGSCGTPVASGGGLYQRHLQSWVCYTLLARCWLQHQTLGPSVILLSAGELFFPGKCFYRRLLGEPDVSPDQLENLQ